MRPSSIVAVVKRVAVALLLVLLLASCSDVGSGDGTRPSISPTRTPTAELPSTTDPTTDPTEPTDPTTEPSTDPTEEPTTEPTTEPAEEPTEEPTTEPTEEPTTELPSPTRTPTRTPTQTEEPETTPTAEPTSTEPTVTEPDEPETATESPEAQDPEAEPTEEDVPAWGLWLVAALVLGSLVAIPLVVRSRRRNAWDQQLAAEEAEVSWLARELLPELRRAASREEVAGGWTVSQARVSAAEDRLTVLESSAPDEPRGARARVVRDASREARAQMQRLLGPGARDTWALDLDAIIIDLESALRPTPADPGTAPPEAR